MRKSIRIFCDITHPVWALRFHTFTGDIWGTLAVVFDAQKFASAEVMRVHSSIGRWNMLQKSYQSGCTGIKREHLWFQKRKKYQWPVQIGDNSDSRCHCFSCKRLRVQLLLQFCSKIIQFNMILETCFYVKHFGFSKCVRACVGWVRMVKIFCFHNN